MTKEEKIVEICQQSINMLSNSLSSMVAHAIMSGYELGWNECMKTLGKENKES